ncbi:MAG: HNH endonuclease [Planctomycetia bacterium]|nr:HNH endonuclease [Planctomycetia bacterium]
MAKWIEWAKRVVERIDDPDRAQRTDALAFALQTELARLKPQMFDLHAAVAQLNIDAYDLPVVTEKVYRSVFTKTWKAWKGSDYARSPLQLSQRQLLGAVAQKLGLDDETTRRLEWETARADVTATFSSAMLDSHIDESEGERLLRLAACLREPLGGLSQDALRPAVEQFLRAEFGSLTSCGNYNPENWESLKASASRLGVSGDQLLLILRPQVLQWVRSLFASMTQYEKLTPDSWRQLVSLAGFYDVGGLELVTVLQPQAVVLVEHTLADAKADGILTTEERANLEWLLSEFSLPAHTIAYVRSEIDQLQLFTDIAQGRLPTWGYPTGFEFRAGEIVHLVAHAEYHRVRQSQRGRRVDVHNGMLVVTDNRMMYSSPTTAFALSHSKVLGIIEYRDCVEIRSGGKSAGFYYFPENKRLAAAIYSTAIGRANQRIVERQVEGISRNIPRDVRQRVWQRYGGRCAECGSDQYLEFDHVVPVSRGGSNSDANVQLLCRRCNLAKSDNI